MGSCDKRRVSACEVPGPERTLHCVDRSQLPTCVRDPGKPRALATGVSAAEGQGRSSPALHLAEHPLVACHRTPTSFWELLPLSGQICLKSLVCSQVQNLGWDGEGVTSLQPISICFPQGQLLGIGKRCFLRGHPFGSVLRISGAENHPQLVLSFHWLCPLYLLLCPR